MATAKKKPTSKRLKEPKRDGELYVTKRLLDLFKKEIRGDITSLRMEMKAGFASINANFANVNTSFAKVDADAAEVNSKINRMLVLFEEQNERNKVVLDSYGLVYDKLENQDERLKKVEKNVFGIEQE